jgi:3'(2'), 5'-bisphosphate nucleotidase
LQVNDKMMADLVIVARKAGTEILKFYKNKDLQAESIKVDSSPVTQADLSASKIIEDALLELYPDIPLLSEESEEIKFEKRHEWSTYFLVDPLDGTKEFIRDSDEFTVNIALINNRESIAGVVYQPVKDICYYGTIEKSFIIENGETKRLPLYPYEEGQLRIVSSKSHKNKETDSYIESLKKSYSVEALVFGSSLKICKVAEGRADLNPRLGGTSEWDIAAGHAVVRGAGGDILQLSSGKRVSYNKENLSNPHYEVRRREILAFDLN